MCRQVKVGYTLCSHVAYDLHYIKCELVDIKCEQVDVKPEPVNDERLCAYTECTPTWMWSDKREEGKCHFCMLEESDAKKKRRRMRKLDLFEDDFEDNEYTSYSKDIFSDEDLFLDNSEGSEDTSSSDKTSSSESVFSSEESCDKENTPPTSDGSGRSE
jgi:hypothetical protein